MSLTFPSFTFSWLSLFPHRPPRAVLFPSSFLEGFPPSSSFVFSFFFPLFPMLFWLLSFFLLKIRNDEKRLFCFVSVSLFFWLKRKREKKQRGTGLMSCPLCFWKAEKGAFCSRWDDENDAVGMGTIALFRVHILFKKSSKFFYTIHTISSCFMDII